MRILIIRTAYHPIAKGGAALLLATALMGCGKVEQNAPRDDLKVRAEAKRQRAACGSSAAYNRLKNLVFDQAIGERGSDRAGLDSLADYSIARMEDPVVNGWEPALDLTRCKGRFILQIPPGAERAFGGQRQLQATVDYTAQAAADGSGFVYRMTGAAPIVAQLAAFNLSTGAYRPPPAIDEAQDRQAAPDETAIARVEMPAPVPDAPTRSAPVTERRPVRPLRQDTAVAELDSEPMPVEPQRSGPLSSSTTGEATVRAFYGALGSGSGGAASAQVVPEKRSSRAFSPAAITRFYGQLAEPIRLTSIVPLARGAYRVSYRYSAGRSRCNGSAIVRLANRDGRDLIRSIDALNGC